MTDVETICEALLVAARVRPDALAYTADGAGITYGALLRDVQHLAARLAAHGVVRGERCALVLPTGLDFIRAAYAAQFAGGVPVAVNPDLPAEAIVRRLGLVRARLSLCGDTAVGTLRNSAEMARDCPILSIDALSRSAGAARPAGTLPEPGSPAFLQLTSGTTGEPRAAIVSHRSLMASLIATWERLEMRQDDILATGVPLHHDLGLVRYVFGAVVCGCPSHLIRPSTANLHPWLDLVSRVRATITGGPDSAYRLAARIVDPQRVDLRSLRFAGNGGETVRLTTIEAFERRFGLAGVVRPAYGLAEATLTVTSTAPGEDLRVDETGTVSCGRPLRGIELRIADADGRPLPTATVGELLVRGAPVFDGYFDDESATRGALRDRWLRTGDMASVDLQGHLFLKGRSRALIKRAGVAIAPREIEDAVDRVAQVSGSAAIGVVRGSDTGFGTEDIVVVAEIRAEHANSRAGLDSILADIDREVRKSLGVAPGRILLVTTDTIPRTAAGKVQYDALRRMVIENSVSGRVLGSR